jgi:hypothetical protein
MNIAELLLLVAGLLALGLGASDVARSPRGSGGRWRGTRGLKRFLAGVFLLFALGLELANAPFWTILVVGVGTLSLLGLASDRSDLPRPTVRE